MLLQGVGQVYSHASIKSSEMPSVKVFRKYFRGWKHTTEEDKSWGSGSVLLSPRALRLCPCGPSDHQGQQAAWELGHSGWKHHRDLAETLPSWPHPPAGEPTSLLPHRQKGSGG